MKKVLIITYYWPPSGGAGVQRMLKLVKYIRSFGWEPIVYTADEAEYPITDNSLEKDIPKGVEIWKHKIWEPYDLYKKFIGQKKGQKVYSGFISEGKKASLTQRLAIWIRGNFFIPDARMFWIKPSVKFLINKLNDYPVDAILSSGPPHSTHRIALGVKRKLNIPWLADFRDPWTKIDFYDQLHLTSLADARHKRMEQEVLKSADIIDCVSWHWADDFEKLSGREVNVVTNGFDEDDFENTVIEKDNKFSICHIGSMNKDRNHPAFWKALNELCLADTSFKSDLCIRLVGKNDGSVYHQLERNNLTSNLEQIDYVPHSEVNTIQAKSSLLLLPLNNTPNVLGIIPGKLFEYLAVKRPILIIGNPLGDSSRIVREANAGTTCGFDDIEDIKQIISTFYKQWKDGILTVDSKGVEQYSRKKVAEKIALLLNKLVSKSSNQN